MEKLSNHGINTQVHYIPIPLHPYYKKKGYKTNNIPKALEYYSGALSIPIHYNLKQKDLKKIVGTIKKVIY